jgi:hypothetical protein
MSERRYTPDNIEELKPNEVFVFGANKGGLHGKGAAKTAVKWGARYLQGVGHWGDTYAIPTKDYHARDRLHLRKIAEYVDDFIEYAIDNPNLTFLVTEIGCGLAGYKPEDIAPLFLKAKDIENIVLPKRFVDLYEQE